MDKLGLLLSNKVLVILSGLMFTGVAFASSGAEALLQNNGISVPETKIPEVQKVASVDSSPLPLSSPQANSQPGKTETKTTPSATPKAATPTPLPTPKRTPVASVPVSSSVSPVVQPTPRPTPSFVAALPSATPSPGLSSANTPAATGTSTQIITGFGESRESKEDEDFEGRGEAEETSAESEISKAFQRARSDED